MVGVRPVGAAVRARSSAFIESCAHRRVKVSSIQSARYVYKSSKSPSKFVYEGCNKVECGFFHMPDAKDGGPRVRVSVAAKNGLVCFTPEELDISH